MPPCLYIGFLLCMHTTMTICKVCKLDKEDIKENWYFNKWKRFWLKCKACTLEWRKSEHERVMARKRDMERYRNNPERRKYLYLMWNKRRKLKWYNPIHLKAEKKITKLNLRPDVCPICWYKWRIIAHHPDYTKPYDVVFCCQICHDKIHKNKIKCPKPITII